MGHKRNKRRRPSDSPQVAALRKAASEGRVEFVSREQIELHEATVDRVLVDVLGLSGYWVSDWSALSDFAPQGLPDAIAAQCDGLPAERTAWRAWVVDELQRRYGVSVAADALLVDVALAIEAREGRAG